MSLTSLSTSFANRYVNAPNENVELHAVSVDAEGGRAFAPGAKPLPGGASAATATGVSDNLKALTDYIPTEIVTIYIAAIAVIQAYAFKDASGSILTGSPLVNAQATYLQATFLGCIIACPLWIFFGIIVASKTTPSWRAFAWPVLAAPLAFVAYAMAIPKSWLGGQLHNGDLFGALLLFAMPPLLHGITQVYSRLVPPQ